MGLPVCETLSSGPPLRPSAASAVAAPASFLQFSSSSILSMSNLTPGYMQYCCFYSPYILTPIALPGFMQLLTFTIKSSRWSQNLIMVAMKGPVQGLCGFVGKNRNKTQLFSIQVQEQFAIQMYRLYILQFPLKGHKMFSPAIRLQLLAQNGFISHGFFSRTLIKPLWM